MVSKSGYRQSNPGVQLPRRSHFSFRVIWWYGLGGQSPAQYGWCNCRQLVKKIDFKQAPSMYPEKIPTINRYIDIGYRYTLVSLSFTSYIQNPERTNITPPILSQHLAHSHADTHAKKHVAHTFGTREKAGWLMQPWIDFWLVLGSEDIMLISQHQWGVRCRLR